MAFGDFGVGEVELQAGNRKEAICCLERGLEVIPGRAIVRLFWEENKEDDISGYRIYRRNGSRGGFVQIGEVQQPMTIFTDRDVQAGTAYEYYVSAYDNASAENESGPSRTLKARP